MGDVINMVDTQAFQDRKKIQEIANWVELSARELAEKFIPCLVKTHGEDGRVIISHLYQQLMKQIPSLDDEMGVIVAIKAMEIYDKKLLDF